MSTISKTTNLELTQYSGITDPIIYSDYTSDMAIIDAACKSLSDDIDALEIDVNALKDRATALENFVNIGTLDTVSQNVTDAINELVNSDIILDGKIDGVSDRVTDAEGDIANLKTWKDDTVDPTLTAYDGRLDAIEAVIETVSTQNIDDMIARIDALEEKVNTNAQNIDTLTENYTRLADRVSDNETEIGNLSGSLATLTNRVALLETCCQEVRATLVQLRTDIDKNASDIAGILTRLTRDESNIAGNASDITLLAQQQTTQAQSINDLYDKIDALDPAQPASLYSRVGALENVVGDANDGLVKDVNDLSASVSSAESDIDVLEGVVGDASSGLVKDVDDLKSTVGDVSSGLVADVGALENTVGDGTAGLVKDVTDLGVSVGSLETTVGDNSSGLIKDVGDLQSAVGDSSSGLVKDVSDLVTTVGDSNSGLVKDVADISDDIGDMSTLDTTATDLVGAINEVNGKTYSYANHEYKTNERWLNGKPIYRRVVSCGTLPTNASTIIPSGCTDVDVYIDLHGVSFKGSSPSDVITLPCAYEAHPINLFMNNNNVRIESSGTWSAFDVTYVYIDYTKTTD